MEAAPGGLVVKPVRARHRVAARVIHGLVGVLGATWRWAVEDDAGITRAADGPGPLIWMLWHNRVLSAPLIHRRFCPHRTGAVLTSPSDDGAILAETMRLFGVGAVRGSSSKRGGRALVELADVLRGGGDVVITPDGPRGPRYRLSRGVPRLALRAGVPVMPLHIEYQSCWRLRSWDGFAVPRPFSGIAVRFGRPVAVGSGAGIESERFRLEMILGEGMLMR